MKYWVTTNWNVIFILGKGRWKTINKIDKDNYDKS